MSIVLYSVQIHLYLVLQIIYICITVNALAT